MIGKLIQFDGDTFLASEVVSAILGEDKEEEEPFRVTITLRNSPHGFAEYDYSFTDKAVREQKYMVFVGDWKRAIA